MQVEIMMALEEKFELTLDEEGKLYIVFAVLVSVHKERPGGSWSQVCGECC